MQVIWDAAFLTAICLVCKGEGYDKEIVALAGDGIGPEIMEAGLDVLEALAKKTCFDYEIDRCPFGGAGY